MDTNILACKVKHSNDLYIYENIHNSKEIFITKTLPFYKVKFFYRALFDEGIVQFRYAQEIACEQFLFLYF